MEYFFKGKFEDLQKYGYTTFSDCGYYRKVVDWSVSTHREVGINCINKKIVVLNWFDKIINEPRIKEYIQNLMKDNLVEEISE